MSPAERVVQAFGSAHAVARALGLNPSSVVRWRLPREQRGLDGRVPSRHQATILRIARESGLHITADDLIHYG
jgi:DNA-binding transcriptional regulator YdaS (Cro superfamily)